MSCWRVAAWKSCAAATVELAAAPLRAFLLAGGRGGVLQGGCWCVWASSQPKAPSITCWAVAVPRHVSWQLVQRQKQLGHGRYRQDGMASLGERKRSIQPVL